MYWPVSLLIFLKCIFVGETIDFESACFGHVIIHSARPRAVIIALIQLGLCVQLRHHLRSRLLIFKQICRQCFCSSNSEIMHFEANAVFPGWRSNRWSIAQILSVDSWKCGSWLKWARYISRTFHKWSYWVPCINNAAVWWTCAWSGLVGNHRSDLQIDRGD